ncbi:MAG: hypothetical protein ACHQ0Y_04965 [Thermodesulfovibrionales bacterium]
MRTTRTMLSSRLKSQTSQYSFSITVSPCWSVGTVKDAGGDMGALLCVNTRTFICPSRLHLGHTNSEGSNKAFD